MDMLPSERRALEAENASLRAEVARYRAREDTPVQAELYQQSQLRFRTVFEHSPLGHKIIDADLTIRQANPAVAAMLGLDSPLDLLGHRIIEFAHPDYEPDWARLQHSLWAHHLPWFSIDTCLVRPDGAPLWCRVTSVLFPDGETELGYTTLEDISARHLLEAQVHEYTQQLLLANQDLDAVNEELLEVNTHLGHLNTELNTFTYAASHDLRLPVANLQGLVQLLVEHLPADMQHTAPVDAILTMMQESMASFRHTLNRLTDFNVARLKAELPVDSVDLATLLEDVRRELAPVLAATEGQLRVEVTGTGRLHFAAKHVYSVLLNLVSNALKYRHPDRAPVVQVRAHREQARFVVEVQDNGLGLSAEQQRQLFRLFKRFHTHVEGTGIGLYLVKKILDNAGGSIQVESKLGQGSTFTASFPI